MRPCTHRLWILSLAGVLASAPVHATVFGNFLSALRYEGAGLDFSIDVSAWDFDTALPPDSFFISPAGATIQEYEFGSGLGTITVDITRSAGAVGPLAGSFHLFADLEIDEDLNGFDNEEATVSGSLGAGNPTSFEVDEPGFVFGDIDLNFEDGALDNFNAVDPFAPDDVSVALGWDFTLEEGESAQLTILISDSGAVVPGSGFSIAHHDPDSDATVTYSGFLAISGGGGGVPPPDNVIPEPATLVLLGGGVAGLAFLRRPRRSRGIPA